MESCHDPNERAAASPGGGANDDADDGAADDFLTKLSRLKQPQLKSVCEANHLMVGGTKPQLQERLVMCKTHGHAGRSRRPTDCGRRRPFIHFISFNECFHLSYVSSDVNNKA